MQLRFLGGAGTVGGSKLLVEHAGHRLLLDCGLFQGLKQLRLHNRAALGVASRSIDAVVLSRADAAHSGFLPRLVELGFDGPVHATPATVALCRLLLPEAGRRFEEEARLANALGYGKHVPALPLYTEDAARRALRLLQPCPFASDFEPAPGFRLRLSPAGQGLGAAIVRLDCGAQSLLYAGTLGRADDPLLRAPAPPEAADLVMLAATYGRQPYRVGEALARLARLISRTAARGGTLLLPAGADGAVPRLLHAIQRLRRAGRIPELPLLLDDRIAADVLALYAAHADELRLDAQACEGLLHGVQVARDADEAARMSARLGPAILIAVDGVACGRAMAQHLKQLLPQSRHAVAFVDWQAAGTRGAALRAGDARIKVHGDWLPVQAEVQALHGLSGHADQQGLLDWVLALPRAPKQLVLAPGEPEPADSLRRLVAERRPWRCAVPEHLEMVNLREAATADEHGA